MPRLPLFVVAEEKLGRASQEMRRLDAYLERDDRAGIHDEWSRTATIAFAVHGIYTGIEDVMNDVARAIDNSVPQGALSHQMLLDQMHVAITGSRPALLDDALFKQLVELKGFRHLVRHNYGMDLLPDKTEAKVRLTRSALQSFKTVMERLEVSLTSGVEDA